MLLDDIINEFYRVCYLERESLYIVRSEDTPVEMIVDDSPTSSDWVEWRLVERSTTIAPEFIDFENEIGCGLPPSFKLWHSRFYTLDGDISLVRLPKIPSNDPFAPLRKQMTKQYLPQTLRQQGYLPFGSDGNDTGPICFHTKAMVENHDYPIYVWDHGRDDSTQSLKLMFSSFQKLLECCVHYWGGNLPDYANLPAKYDGFAVIDPDGAGKYFLNDRG